MSIVRAKEIILDRVSTEVFLGHNAIGVYIALSDHSLKLKTLPFRQALGTVQRHALDAFILSLCKLYEKPNQRYPNFSIPTTLALLREDTSGISAGIQNYIRLERFIQSNIDSTFTVRGPDEIARIPALVLDYFAEQCPRTPVRNGKELDRIFDAMKTLRDKRVAHHEDAGLSSLSKTDLDGALRLLAFAQTYVNLVGSGFFGFSQKGEVDAATFHPCKSIVWPELNRMIGLLEQDAPHGAGMTGTTSNQ
jgi:hypothetical protein